MPFIMRSSAAFSWLSGSFGFIRFFSEGTWSARGWRCPTGASGSNCWSEFIDGGAAGFREPAGCAIATELSTRASNAIVVINFRMMGLPVGAPSHDHGEGKLNHKVRKASRVGQTLQHSGAPAMLRGSFLLLWARMPQTIAAEIRPRRRVVR